MTAGQGNPEKMQKLIALIDSYCAGTITPEDLAELELLLETDQQARHEFRQQMFVHASLFEAADMAKPDAAILKSADHYKTKARKRQLRRKWTILAAALAVVALAAVIATRDPIDNSTPNDSPVVVQPGTIPIQSTEPTTPGYASAAQGDKALGIRTPKYPVPAINSKHSVAVVQRVVDAVWHSTSPVYRPGDSIDAGDLRLDSGLAEIVFLSGASAIIEGPANLELKTSFRGLLYSGKVRLHVPRQARGFVLETSKAQYVDLGTEFAVEVTEDGRTDLHVFDGQVEVRPTEGSPPNQLVNSGDGLTVNKQSEWTTMKSISDRFTDSNKVSELASVSDVNRYNSWLQDREAIQSHPDLIAYFDFEPDTAYPQTLANLKDERTNGAVIGSRWAEGRWPGKGALEFKRPHDRVRLNIPGTFESLTMTTWLRLDGFDRFFNSILLTDRFDNGDVHWQIKSDGKLDMGIKPKDETRLLFLTNSPVLGYDDLGRWMHLAVVIDRGKGTGTHYWDGKPVYRADLSTGDDQRRNHVSPFALRIGQAELGNWSPRGIDDPWTVRNLNGRIDEFAIYASALSDEEIHELYEVGKP